MCLFNPSTPQMPKMPEPPPPPPTPVTPSTPTVVKPATSQKEATMRGRRGPSMLSIPLSTGGSKPSGAVNLNIGK